jgi:membrane protein DedA with SNARE-associated domain
MAVFEFFIQYLEQFSYVAIVLLMLIGSLGLPFPEEIVMWAAGYAAQAGYMNLYGAIIVSFFAVIGGDLVGYAIGHHGGKLFKRLLSKEKFMRVEKYFERHGSKTIFVSRFLLGIRVFFPIAAGATKMRLREFLLWDTLAALIWVPLMVLLGYWFGSFIPKIIGWLRKADLVMGIAFAIFLIVLLFVYKERKVIVRTIEHWRHGFFKHIRKNEKPLEVLMFGTPAFGQRVYSKQRTDGKVTLFVEFLKAGEEVKCLHARRWLHKHSYDNLVRIWSGKLGRPKKESWPARVVRPAKRVSRSQRVSRPRRAQR